MGMFDYVELPITMICPTCCSVIDGFQSKDGDCTLATIPYTECYTFYTHCGQCKRWVEYRRKRANGLNPLDDYELVPEYHPVEYDDEEPYQI